MTFYNIFDFKAVTKHAYYAQKNRTQDTVTCPETGEVFPSWHAGVNAFLSIYMEQIDTARTLLVAHDMGMDYRKAFFPEYKEKRGSRKISKLEREQLNKVEAWAKRFFAAIGATQIGVDGVEADDVIAWLCKAQDSLFAVYTVDADLLQLVDENTMVFLKGEPHTPGGEHNGVPYPLTSFSKALLGDTSDGYKGLPQFGPAKWEALLNDIGEEGIKKIQGFVEALDFEGFCREFSDSSSAELKRIADGWSTVIDQYRLSRLHPQLCWKPRGRKLTKPKVHKRVPNAQQVYNLLVEVGAEDLWESKYSSWVPGVLGVDANNWPEIKDQVYQLIAESDVIAYDFESTDKLQAQRFRKASTKDFVDVLSQEVAGVSLCFGEHLQNVIYMSCDHADTANLAKSEIAEILMHVSSVKGTPVAHNAFFEGVVGQKDLGVNVHGVHDTRVMARYSDENEQAGLKALSLRLLGYEQGSYEQTLAAAGVTRMCDLTLGQVLKYGADDALVTGHLYDLQSLLLQLEHQWDFYKTWAVHPTQTIQSAFLHGVRINWKLQKEVHERDLKTIEVETAKLRELLEQNCSGIETEGCKSYLAAEKKYMTRALKDKHGEEGWEREYWEWEAKTRKACNYTPFEQFEEWPEFLWTATKLSEIAVPLGFAPVEKVTLKYLAEYIDMYTTLTQDEGQDFIELLKRCLDFRVDKLKKEPTEERQILFDRMAQLWMEVHKPEPRIVKMGDELNVGSSSQSRHLLYCKIGVPVRLFGQAGVGRLKYGLTEGGPATDEDAIRTALALDAKGWQVDALKCLLKVKSANTRCNLFHQKMPLWVHEDGKLHPYITDAGTDTRRPTGSSPNILQIPARGEGAVMRSLYMPPERDWVCVAIDFSGQELRLLACESNDPRMIEAYTPGKEKDIHSMTAVGVAIKKGIKELSEFEVLDRARKDDRDPLFELASDLRDKAKACNFLMAYAGGPGTLSRNLIVDLEEGKQLLEGTMALYSRIQPWQEETSKFMSQNGFTITPWGTRRHATDDIFSKDGGKVARVHRQGCNFTIQGTAADGLRTILTRLYTEGHIYDLRMVHMAPIYDEIVSFVHKDDVVKYCGVMKRLMSEATPPGHIVPQVPEFSIGADWGKTHELGAHPTDEQIQTAVEQALEEGKEVWDTDMTLTYEDVFGCSPEEFAERA